MQQNNTLDAEIKRLINELRNFEVGSVEYQAALDDLKKLEMVKDRERRRKWYNNIDSKTVVIGSMMILQTLIVLNYEQIGFVASKAFPGIIKPKI